MASQIVIIPNTQWLRFKLIFGKIKKISSEYPKNNWVFWVWVWVLYPTRLGIWVLGMGMRAIPIPKPNTHKILGMNVWIQSFLNTI